MKTQKAKKNKTPTKINMPPKFSTNNKSVRSLFKKESQKKVTTALKKLHTSKDGKKITTPLNKAYNAIGDYVFNTFLYDKKEKKLFPKSPYWFGPDAKKEVGKKYKPGSSQFSKAVSENTLKRWGDVMVGLTVAPTPKNYTPLNVARFKDVQPANPKKLEAIAKDSAKYFNKTEIEAVGMFKKGGTFVDVANKTNIDAATQARRVTSPTGDGILVYAEKAVNNSDKKLMKNVMDYFQSLPKNSPLMQYTSVMKDFYGRVF